MSLSQQGLYRFDEFELDRTKRTLLRNGSPVSLAPKAFDVLSQLLANPGRVVTKEELMQAVWPDSFVEEGNLAYHISGLRRSFADRAGYIVTIPGRGYQFTAEVLRQSPAAAEPTVPDQPLSAEVAVAGIQTVHERTHIVVEETIGRQRGARSQGTILWVCGGMVAIGLAAVAGWRWAHPPSYGHAEAVIADLDNATGDADFDHSLNRMLQIDLQQSPYFTIVGEGRKRETLRTMRQPDGEPITAPLAREICQRLNGQIYITPALAKVGDRYLVSLEANDCVDGHSLGSGHKEGTSKNEVLAALAALTQQVRHDTGESRASIRQFDKPLFNSYTASLDALKAYSEATRLGIAGKFSEAIPLYHRAIELDPKFAAAYGDMASMYFNMGDDQHDREAATKAYALRDTVNDYERFFIEYGYHSSVTGDLHAQLDVLRQWAGTYPNDSLPLAALVNLETQMGEFGNAAAYADRALDLQRKANLHNGTIYDVAARAYHHANMPDKVRAVYREAMQADADSEGLHSTMLGLAIENGDAAGMEREIAWSRGKPDESRILLVAALAALANGQARHSDALFAEATSAARRDKLEDILGNYEDYHARMLVELGLTNEAREILRRLPTGDPSTDRLFTEAEVGDAAKVLTEAQRVQDAAPNDVFAKVEYTPSVHAVIALRQGKPGEAIALLEADVPYELRNPTVPYLRGQAYLAMRQGPQATLEFAKIADKPWLADPPSPLIALASLNLARAYALDGNSAGSRNEYQRFFTLWRDADADLPILRQAHLEYQRIR
jgi:eukaryotic-like serine/threonine-protein kinase